jgi:opacity protein-like surface antigen
MVRLALVIAAIAGCVLCPDAGAQGFTSVRSSGRGANWEFSLPLIYIDSTTITGQGGSSVDLNSDWGWGFGFNYNFNDNFQLGGLLSFSTRSYDATVVQDTGGTRRYSNITENSSLTVNGVYYLLNGAFTPFVSGGSASSMWIPTSKRSCHRQLLVGPVVGLRMQLLCSDQDRE